MLQRESDLFDGRLVHMVSSHIRPVIGTGHPPASGLIDFYVNVNFDFEACQGCATLSRLLLIRSVVQTNVMENL